MPAAKVIPAIRAGPSTLGLDLVLVSGKKPQESNAIKQTIRSTIVINMSPRGRDHCVNALRFQSIAAFPTGPSDSATPQYILWRWVCWKEAMVIRLTPFTFTMLLALLLMTWPASALDDAQIADAIARLSDPDAAVRERAADALWAAGRPAEPTGCDRRLASDDPEIVRRARSLLVRFELGLYPDHAAGDSRSRQRYRGGNAVARWAAVHGLANHGNRGLRVLVGLRHLSTDEATRGVILRAIGSRPHERQGAALLLSDGDVAGAESILQHAALEGENAIRDYAAFLLLHGGLDEQINVAQAAAKLNPDGFPGLRVVYLTRAKGDLTAALHAADASDDTGLVDSVLVESRNWNRLALRYRDRPANSSETLGFTAAFCRFACQTGGIETAAAALRTFSDQHEDEYWKCAECLMLNDRVDEGVAILLAHFQRITSKAAMDFLLARPEVQGSGAAAAPAQGEGRSQAGGISAISRPRHFHLRLHWRPRDSRAGTA